jgi:hypothetical protein
MTVNTPAKSVEVSAELVEALRSFPRARTVDHCGSALQVSPLALYAECPICRQRVKLRAFSAEHEIEDVFDAVLEWMNEPQALAYAEQRRKEIGHDA